jgi:hypothetical protein
MRRFSVLVLAMAACTGSTEVAPGPGTLERVTPASVTGVVGTMVGPATVLVRDHEGHPRAGVEVLFTADSSSGHLMDNSLQTGADGTATAEWIAGPVAGTQTITARSAGLAGLTFAAVVRPGPVALLTRLLGNNQFGLEHTGLPSLLSVKVTDSFYNAVAGVQVVFTVIGGEGSIAGDTTTTNSLGIADSGEWILGGAGNQQVRARSGDAEIVFHALACSDVEWGCGEFDETATTLAFVRERQIYRTSLDGTQVVQITNDAQGYNHSPSWSPDRSRIAFVRYDGGQGSNIFTVKAGGEVSRRTTGGEFYEPEWSPDGRQLVLSGFGSRGYGIYLLDAATDGAQPIFLTQGWSPTWSPNGTRIAFMNGGGVHVINADGTSLSRLILSDRWLDQPSWSPDGRSMAVTSYSNCDWEDDCDTSVEVLDLASSQFRVLMPGASGAAWSPDGAMVAFSRMVCSSNSCSQSLSAINADGTGERVIVADGWTPSWRR